MRIELDCPAKINLFLAVGPRDETGYHPLRTVFQAVDLCDTLTLALGKGATRIDCNWPGLPAENTLTKALRYLGEYVSLSPLEVTLTKRIPAQSGLGGGSSDAAGLLRGVRELLQLRVSDRDLHDVATAVGADVPFFLVGGRARAEGYGEKLSPLEDAPTQWVLIARPDVDGPTPEAYRSLDRLEYRWRAWPDEEELHNDFERVAPDLCKDLLARMVRLGASGSLLCGSGSAVFGLFCDEQVAREAATRLRSENVPQTWVARTLSRLESVALRRL
jgi:4-diphosphocytidyl-2-C-methyl-D-erythritol kinase